MPHDTPEFLTALGRTNFRDRRVLFGISQPNRLFHMYAIGKTGTGKSTLLETLIQQDVAGGHGLCLIDPHGDLVERVVAAIPDHRREDVHYLDMTDSQQPFGYNPLRPVHPSLIPLAAAGLMEALKKHWTEAWGVRMEHILRNSIYTLLETEGATLPDILRLLTDKSYRKGVVGKLANEQVKLFWLKEFEHYSPRYRADAIAPVQNKIGALLVDPRLRRLFAHPLKPLRFRQLMDGKKILLVNLARGQVGEDSASLLGSLLVTTIGLAAFSRADVPEDRRVNFFLYLDEFQNFTTASVATMISELRKYRVGLILANQHLAQLSEEVREAVLGNVGTLISFRVGPHDATLLAKEFGDQFSLDDVMNLPNHHIYLHQMIDGAPSKPFSATTILPSDLPGQSTGEHPISPA